LSTLSGFFYSLPFIGGVLKILAKLAAFISQFRSNVTSGYNKGSEVTKLFFNHIVTYPTPLNLNYL